MSGNLNKLNVNILFLCHKMPFPPNDGGAIATLNMIEGFASHADKVSVLAMQTHKHSYAIDKLPADIKSTIHWNSVEVNTKLNPIAAVVNLLFSKKPYNGVRFESREFSEALVQLLKEDSFDIIQLEGLYLYSYIDVIRKHSKAKIALRAHNIENEIWKRLAENETFIFKKYYFQLIAKRIERLESKILNEVDLLVPITNRDAEVLKMRKVENVMVSPTGIADSKFKMTQPKFKKSLFYIGALDWMPNQEAIRWFLNEIWSDLKLEFPDWEFVVAGRNASSSFVSEMQKHPIKFVGEVESAHEFIDTYNIMLVPLLAGSGMRIKIIEGMARGKCIVTTKIGAEGIPAINKQDIYIEDLVEDFKQVLKNLMQNQDQIEKCGQNAYIFVGQNYNNNVIINSLRQFYKKHIGFS